MTNALKVVAPFAVQDSFSDIYTPGGGVTFTTGVIHIANTHTAAVTLELCIDDGGGDVQTNALLWDISIPANDFIEFGQGIILAAGSSLSAKASVTDKIIINLSGIETT